MNIKYRLYFLVLVLFVLVIVYNGRINNGRINNLHLVIMHIKEKRLIKQKIKKQKIKKQKVKQMLKLTLDVFNKHNVPCWADFGTLLGFIREKDVILHDYDADFSIDLANINTLYNSEVRNALNKKGLCLVKSTHSCFKIYNLSTVKDPNIEFFYKRTTHIDIFPYIFKHPDKIALRAYLKWDKESKGVLPKFYKNCITDSCELYLVKDFKKVWVKAWNNYCNIPINYHQLLVYRYGSNYMISNSKYKTSNKIIDERYNKFKSYYDLE